MKLEEILKNIKVGDKLFWVNQKQPYTVKARNKRYIIVTKPFNLKKTVCYSIIDTKCLICGPNNYVFNPYDYSKQEDIEQSLKDLGKGEYEISYRHQANFLDCFLKIKTNNKTISLIDLKALEN